MHGELKGLQVVNVAEGEKKLRGKRLLDETSSVTRWHTSCRNELRTASGWGLSDGVDNHGELSRRAIVNRWMEVSGDGVRERWKGLTNGTWSWRCCVTIRNLL